MARVTVASSNFSFMRQERNMMCRTQATRIRWAARVRLALAS